MDGDEAETESFQRFKSDVKATAKNGIVLSGVLAWVDIQSHTTAEGVRQEQMASLFTVEEIEEAIEDLWGVCGGADSVIGTMPRRNIGPNKVKNLVDDLFKAFNKLTENDKKPAILTTSVQMRTIRPYNVDDSNINQSDVMERVKLLEGCISNQNKTIMDLVSKIENLSQAQAQMSKPVHLQPPPPPAEWQDREGATGGFPPLSRTVNLLNQAYNRTPKRRRVSEEVVNGSMADIRNAGTGAGAGNQWATVAGRNLERQGKGVQKEQEPDLTPRRHWRQKSLIVNGSSNTNNDDKSFAADICLVAGGVSKNATVEKLTEYLQNKGLNIVKCDLLTNPTAIDNVRSLSFKVTIKAEDLEKASDASIWPYRVVVRKFVNFRKRETDEFAPNDQNMAGVRPLGHTQAPQHLQGQQQQGGHTLHGGGASQVTNRFDVPGFRDGESH